MLKIYKNCSDDVFSINNCLTTQTLIMTRIFSNINPFGQSEIYLKNNPRYTDFEVKFGFTDLEMSFGELLKEKLQEKKMKPAQLARLSGVSKQNIGRIINNTPHSITGALPKTEPETIKKLAKALDWDLDEALLAGGYAPSNQEESLDNLIKPLSSRAKEHIRAIVKTFVEAESALKKAQDEENATTLDDAIAEDEDDEEEKK